MVFVKDMGNNENENIYYSASLTNLTIQSVLIINWFCSSMKMRS